jgi:hypothetical protein
MTYIPTEAGCMRLQDSARLLRAVYPSYPELLLCNPVPALELLAAALTTPVYTQS